MANTREVEDRLPGLRFHVETSTVSRTASGIYQGYIRLRCEITNRALWEEAVAQFEDLKIFTDPLHEMIDALGQELDSSEVRVKRAEDHAAELQLAIQERDEEIARLNALLSQIGTDLGLGG